MRGRIGAAHLERHSPRRTLFIHIGLGLALLLAASLRFYRLEGQSFWSDEGDSVALAQAGMGEIAARTALDIHPPLYYWLLHGWMRISGQSEAAVRSLSVVASVLLVAVVYRLGTRLFDRRAGLLAAFITAVSPFQVYYAQEARMYALLALFGATLVLATIELIGYERRVTWDAVSKPYPIIPYALLYILAAALGLYTHYAFPLMLVATNVAFLAHLWRTREKSQVAHRLIGWLALQVVLLALYLPWLPVAWRQLTTWPAPRTEAENVLVTLWRTLVLGPTSGGASGLWLLMFAVLGLIGAIRLLRRRTLPEATLVLLYLGLPIVLTLVLFKPAYLKFLLMASPALFLLLAVAPLGGRDERGVSLGGWLVAILMGAAVWVPLRAYYADPTIARDDYRGMALYLEAVAGPEDSIILNSGGQKDVFGYYYEGDSPVYPLPRRRPLDPEATVEELETILARSRHVFGLYWATNESDPAGVIEGWLDRHAYKATDTWVGNVRLVSYAAPLLADDLLPTDLPLGDHIRLTGYQLLYPSASDNSALRGDGVLTGDGTSTSHMSDISSFSRAVPGEIVQAQLRWTTDVPLNARYVVFLQALDEANHLVGQRDAEPVISTVDWRPGDLVLDGHGLLIEPGTPPGEYRIIAGLYDAFTGQRLPTSSGDFVELGRFTIERPIVPPPTAALRFRYPADVDFGPLRLLGYDRYKLGHSYDPETPLHPGDPLHVVLYWQAQSRSQTDWKLALQLAPVADPASPVAEGVFPVAGLDYPTTQWEPGEVVRAQFDLFLPGDATSGDYLVGLHLLHETGSPTVETFTLVPVFIE